VPRGICIYCHDEHQIMRVLLHASAADGQLLRSSAMYLLIRHDSRLKSMASTLLSLLKCVGRSWLVLLSHNHLFDDVSRSAVLPFLSFLQCEVVLRWLSTGETNMGEDKSQVWASILCTLYMGRNLDSARNRIYWPRTRLYKDEENNFPQSFFCFLQPFLSFC
jgi:hypothetical protein